MTQLPALERRRRAVQKVLTLLEGKSLVLGRRDCVTMSAQLLRALGHEVPKLPTYKGATGALRALQAQGVTNLAELLDARGLPRIAPAAALLGDLLFLPGDDDESAIGALVIALGNGAGMGFHGAHPGLVRMRVLDVQAAWRTLP